MSLETGLYSALGAVTIGSAFLTALALWVRCRYEHADRQDQTLPRA